VNIDTRIYAYVGDGYILCNGCAAEAVEAGATVDQSGGTSTADLAPLGAYSGLFDRECGEWCECGATIVEPAHEDGDECGDCGWGE
jgi:hypothetical protein